ncbi:MAG TPA: hypothetical protein VKE74_07310, partial [Gemmataceae bacterium]|nr:hypothetical protein [Gemmataceae bacterium]
MSVTLARAAVNAGSPPTFFEVLEPTRSSSHNAVQFTPGGRPGCGLLVIGTKRSHTQYALAEFPTDPRFADGRGFHLEKLTTGTDPEADSYDVFICRRHESGDSCDCRGRERWGHCKHTSALRALLVN